MNIEWIEFNKNTEGLKEGEHYRIRTKTRGEHRVLFKNDQFVLDSHMVEKENGYEPEVFFSLKEVEYIRVDF